MKHASHHDIINRLKRTDGHLRKVISMIEDGRPCMDLAQQLHAVERAVSAAKKTLIQDHIDECLSDPRPDPADHAALIQELRDITRYL
ncbi:MAG: metal-sensing transcriptional repressor [Pseudomonadota bacterium]